MFSIMKHSSIQELRNFEGDLIEDGGILGETGILPQWRLSVPKPGFERGGCNNWEIRDAPQDIFKGA